MSERKLGKCLLCGVDMDMVGKAHRCVVREEFGARPKEVVWKDQQAHPLNYVGAEVVTAKREEAGGRLAARVGGSDPMVEGRARPTSETYKYRDPLKRRAQVAAAVRRHRAKRVLKAATRERI